MYISLQLAVLSAVNLYFFIRRKCKSEFLLQNYVERNNNLEVIVDNKNVTRFSLAKGKLNKGKFYYFAKLY